MYYKEKYLKYKNKYLNLKNQFGGIRNNYHLLNEIPVNENIEEQLIKDGVIKVLMNCYHNIDSTNTLPLVTIGINDCVVLIIYNPIHGRYLGHFSKYNLFDINIPISNACEYTGKQEFCQPTVIMDECDSGSVDIKSSLPVWISEEETIIHIFSFMNISSTISRFNQLFEFLKGSNIDIHIYFNNLEMSNKTLMETEYIDHQKNGTVDEEFENEYKISQNAFINARKYITKYCQPDFFEKWENHTLPLYSLSVCVFSDGTINLFDYGRNKSKYNKGMRFGEFFYNTKKEQKHGHFNDKCISNTIYSFP